MRTPPYGPWRDALADPALAALGPHPLRHDADLHDAGSQEMLVAAVRAFLATLTAAQPGAGGGDRLWQPPGPVQPELGRGLG